MTSIREMVTNKIASKIAGRLHVIFSQVCYAKNLSTISFFLLKLSEALTKVNLKFFSDFELTRLRDAISVGNSKVKNLGEESATIEVVILSSENDLVLLPYSLEFAARSLSQFKNLNFIVIVPDKLLAVSLDLVGNNSKVTVISENSLIPESLFKQLRILFGDRYTWVLQQIIKLKYASLARSDFILLLDADTMLLNSRSWIDTRGRQILMPSY